LLGTLIVRRLVHRRESEVRFAAGLFEVLVGQGRRGIVARTRLHRSILLTLRRAAILPVDFFLDVAFPRRGVFGLPAETVVRGGWPGHGLGPGFKFELWANTAPPVGFRLCF